jgi:hypothetical protein
MKTHTHSPRFWSTSSFGGNTDTSPMDLLSLGDHLGTCRSQHGHLFVLHCMAEALRGFMAARFMTTLIGLVLLVVAANLTL